MLATEARAAVEAAEVASLAAQEAHAKAQMVLAGIEAASTAEIAAEATPDPFWERQVGEVVPFAPVMREAPAREAPAREAPAFEADDPNETAFEHFVIRWERELPMREEPPEAIRASVGPSLFETMTADWEETELEQAQPQEIAVIEPAQPIFGNVIEFPRQIVATRKVRPRLIEGPLSTPAAGAQLSIFEVDPGAISVEPEVASPGTIQQVEDWSVPEWSSIKFAPALRPEPVLLEEPEPRPAPAPEIELASLSRRMLAGVVDFTLVAGACALAAAALAANNASALPGLRAVEIGTVVALLIASAAYKLPVSSRWLAPLRE